MKELEEYLDRRIAESEKVRAKSWKRDFSSIEAYEKSVAGKREELWDLLGGKPTNAAPLAPKEEMIAEFETHRAYRVWLGAFDTVRVYGILLISKVREPPPALICIQGMTGWPEAVCGLTEKPDYARGAAPITNKNATLAWVTPASSDAWASDCSRSYSACSRRKSPTAPNSTPAISKSTAPGS